MEFKTRRIDGFLVVEIWGKISRESARNIDQRLNEIVLKGNNNLLLNLLSLEVVDSAIIGSIVNLWKCIGENHGSLFITASPQLRDKLEEMKLNLIIKIFSSQEEFISAVIEGDKTKLPSNVDSLGKYKILRIREELGIMAYATELERDLSFLIENGYNFIVLDLSEISYIYSDVLGAVIAAAKVLKDKHGNLCIFGLNDDLIALAKKVYLDTLIEIYRNEHEFRMVKKL